MRRRHPRRPAGGRRLSVAALAGWLFADMLLVLVVVSLGDQADPLAAAPRPTASPSATPSPTPTPSPSATTAKPRNVDRKWFDFKVSGDDKAALAEQIRQQIAPRRDREAALVQTFGGGEGGTSYANLVNSVLQQADSHVFGPAIVTQDFLDLSASPSTATVRVFFFGV